MSIILEEPLKTFVERQLHTNACERYVRSHLYNILWHKGSQPVATIGDILDQHIAMGMVPMPSLSLNEEVLLVEIASYAPYRANGKDWSKVVLDTTTATWLHTAIHAQASGALDAIMRYEAAQIADNLVAIARTLRFKDAWILGGTDPDGLINRITERTRPSNSVLGTTYHLPTGQLYMQELRAVSLHIFEHGLSLGGLA